MLSDLPQNQSIIFELQHTFNNFVSEFKDSEDALQMYKTTGWLHQPQFFETVQLLYSEKISLSLQKEIIQAIMPDLISDMNIMADYKIVVTDLDSEQNTYQFCVVELLQGHTPVAFINLFDNFSVDSAGDDEIDELQDKLKQNKITIKGLQGEINALYDPRNQPKYLYDHNQMNWKDYFKYSYKPDKWNLAIQKKRAEYEQQINNLQNDNYSLTTELQSAEERIQNITSLVGQIKDYSRNLQQQWQFAGNGLNFNDR